jgi:hypothetical protein
MSVARHTRSQHSHTKPLPERNTSPMHTKFTRVATATAILAAGTVGLLSTGSGSAFAAAPKGANTLSPSPGNSDTVFTMSPPAGASCSGAGTAGYRWQTYMVDAGVDASTLTFGNGPLPVASHFVSKMYDGVQNSVVNKNPSSTGQIVGIPNFSFSALAGVTVPAGAYKIGIACSLNNGTATVVEGGNYWETPITITTDTTTGGVANFDYAFGSVASAPVLSTPLTLGDTTLSGSFTATASTPATTGFTVTAHPLTGTSTDATLAVAAAGPFTLAGLTNGVSYAVSVVATNPVGNSAPSNIVIGQPDFAQRPPITNPAASQITGPGVHFSWVAPTGAIPSNYTIGITPAVANAPTTAAGSATSIDITGLVDGTPYTLTVQANYASAPLTGQTASAPFTYAGAIVIQDVTVTRPAGALILTQVCGVTSGFLAGTATPAFPATAAIPAVSSGTAPTLNAGPFNATSNPADPQYGNYPYPSPAKYPTHCAVNLGNASFVTTGPLAGQYYAASGSISQVTVVDNRDASFAGWTVNGSLPSFVGLGSNNFSGSYLGWEPKVSSVTTGQVVNPGAIVDPTTTSGVGGLLASNTLASAPTKSTARGVATLDARLKVLIPVSVATGAYTGVLSLSAI